MDLFALINTTSLLFYYKQLARNNNELQQEFIININILIVNSWL